MVCCAPPIGTAEGASDWRLRCCLQERVSLPPQMCPATPTAHMPPDWLPEATLATAAAWATLGRRARAPGGGRKGMPGVGAGDVPFGLRPKLLPLQALRLLLPAPGVCWPVTTEQP